MKGRHTNSTKRTTSADVLAFMKGYANDMEEEIKGVGTKIEKINERIDTIDARIDGIDTKIDDLGNRVDGLGTRMDKMETRMELMSKNMLHMELRLENKIENAEAKVNKKTQELRNEMNTQFDSLAHKIQTFESETAAGRDNNERQDNDILTIKKHLHLAT